METEDVVLSDQKFNCLLKSVLYKRFGGVYMDEKRHPYIYVCVISCYMMIRSINKSRTGLILQKYSCLSTWMINFKPHKQFTEITWKLSIFMIYVDWPLNGSSSQLASHLDWWWNQTWNSLACFYSNGKVIVFQKIYWYVIFYVGQFMPTAMASPERIINFIQS